MDVILLTTHDAAERGRLRQDAFVVLPRMNTARPDLGDPV